MRIILVTDKKQIIVPWNYQEKLNAINEVIMDATHDESKLKTFKGYINEIWREAIDKSDKSVVTARKPSSSKKK